MNYDAEALAIIEALEGNGLNEALDRMISELLQVSTFAFEGDHEFKCAEELVPWLQDIQLGKRSPDHPQLFYALHLIATSATRPEELNGQHLTLDSVRDVLEAKLQLFEYAGRKDFDSLLELAEAVKDAREKLPKHLFAYQAIDGTNSSLHRELTTKWVKPEDFDTYAEETRLRVANVRSVEDAMQLLDEMTAQLRQFSQTDYTLVCGPRRALEPGQDVPSDGFFAYLFTERSDEFLENTSFSNMAGLAEFLLPTFQGCMRRYHLEGYKAMMPGICVNEAIRDAHVQAGHKANIRTAHPVLDRAHQVVDVRCIATREPFEGISTTNLSYQRYYTALIADLVGHCIEQQVLLPGVMTRDPSGAIA